MDRSGSQPRTPDQRHVSYRDTPSLVDAVFEFYTPPGAEGQRAASAGAAEMLF